MARDLRGSVVVVTGASSGIGRAAALAFAQRGAQVVVAARRAEALRMLVAECERMGPGALAVLTDVTEGGALDQLAERAIERFGRIDVWVNNAGVYLAGTFEDTPPEAFRRVIETNFFGYVDGARAALAQFRRQGGGVLINNASVDSQVPAPYFSAYVASKFAVLGWSRTLRLELRDSGIDVCTVLPSGIDTPIFQHAANYTGRALKALDPTYEADRVAQAIVSLAERPRRQATVGGAGKILTVLNALAPALADRVMARQIEIDHFQDKPAARTLGILFAPDPRWSGVSGGWPHTGELPLWRITATGLVAAGPAVFAWKRLRSRKRRRLPMLLAR